MKINGDLFKGLHLYIIFHQHQTMPAVGQLHDGVQDLGLQTDLLVYLLIDKGFKFDQPIILVRILRALCAVRIVVLRDGFKAFPCSLNQTKQGFNFLVDSPDTVQVLFCCRMISSCLSQSGIPV